MPFYIIVDVCKQKLAVVISNIIELVATVKCTKIALKFVILDE